LEEQLQQLALDRLAGEQDAIPADASQSQ
jgi:hypothetical protein